MYIYCHYDLVKTNTKKITSLFFILLGFTPLLLVLTFHFKKEDIRHRMKEKLETARELQTLVIPLEKVIWMDDHEIWINNQMFDIHTKTLDNGIYTFKGLYDQEETELENQKKNSNRKNQEEEKLLSNLFKWINTTYREKPMETTIQAKMFNDHFIYDETFLNFCFHKVPTPPPRSHTENTGI